MNFVGGASITDIVSRVQVGYVSSSVPLDVISSVSIPTPASSVRHIYVTCSTDPSPSLTILGAVIKQHLPVSLWSYNSPGYRSITSQSAWRRNRHEEIKVSLLEHEAFCHIKCKEHCQTLRHTYKSLQSSNVLKYGLIIICLWNMFSTCWMPFRRSKCIRLSNDMAVFDRAVLKSCSERTIRNKFAIMLHYKCAQESITETSMKLSLHNG